MEGVRECSLYKYQIDSLPEVLEHTCFIKEPLQIGSKVGGTVVQKKNTVLVGPRVHMRELFWVNKIPSII